MCHPSKDQSSWWFMAVLSDKGNAYTCGKGYWGVLGHGGGGPAAGGDNESTPRVLQNPHAALSGELTPADTRVAHVSGALLLQPLCR